MMKDSLAVPAACVLIGIMAGVLAGTPAAVAVFTGAAVAGSIAVALWRQHSDRKELERSLVPVRVRRAAGGDPPVRRPG